MELPRAYACEDLARISREAHAQRWRAAGADQIADVEQQTVDVEVWDLKGLKSFRGEAQVNLQEALDRGHVVQTLRCACMRALLVCMKACCGAGPCSALCEAPPAHDKSGCCGCMRVHAWAGSVQDAKKILGAVCCVHRALGALCASRSRLQRCRLQVACGSQPS